MCLRVCRNWTLSRISLFSIKSTLIFSPRPLAPCNACNACNTFLHCMLFRNNRIKDKKTRKRTRRNTWEVTMWITVTSVTSVTMVTGMNRQKPVFRRVYCVFLRVKQNKLRKTCVYVCAVCAEIGKEFPFFSAMLQKSVRTVPDYNPATASSSVRR